MPRSNDEIGKLAFRLFQALSRVEFTYDEMRSLGECIYANGPKKAGVALSEEKFTAQGVAVLAKVNHLAVRKLFLATAELDAAFPLPASTTVAPEAPTPASTTAAPEAPTPTSTTAVPEAPVNGASAPPAGGDPQ
jgi:hypothetical protein